MTIYKVTRNLSHIRTNEKLYIGAFCSDNPDAIDAEQVTIDGVVWRDGFLAKRPQNDINVLLGYAIDIVDTTHPDYQRLVDVGIIKSTTREEL